MDGRFSVYPLFVEHAEERAVAQSLDEANPELSPVLKPSSSKIVCIGPRKLTEIIVD
jgi:hypothetical protein